MTFKQTFRMLLYRWKLFLLVFVVSLSVTTVFVLKLTEKPMSEIINMVGEQKIEYSAFTIYQTAFLEQDAEQDIFPYLVIAEDYLRDDALLKNLCWFWEDTQEYPLDKAFYIEQAGKGLKMTVKGEDASSVERANVLVGRMLAEKITQDYKRVQVIYQTKQMKVAGEEAIQETMPVAKKDTLGRIEALLIAVSLSAFFTLAIVLMREKTDPTIRSGYHLKQMQNVKLLPFVSPKQTEPELFALANQVFDEGKEKVCIFSGIKTNDHFPQLVFKLAEQVARKEYRIVIIDFNGILSVNNTSEFISILQEPKRTTASLLSEEFSKDLHSMTQQYEKIIIVAAPAENSAESLSLIQYGELVYLVQFGKDTVEALQEAIDRLGPNTQKLKGISITDYRPSVDYIWEEDK